MSTGPLPPPSRVLIVDDEPDICALLSHLLVRAGFDTVTALNGHAALCEIDSGRVDMVVLDFKLPDMTGLDVLTAARQRAPQLPAVMVTAHADVRGAVEAMRVGVYDYLAKPFDNEVVVSTVRAALAQSGRAESGKNRPGKPAGSAGALRDSMGPSAAIDQLIGRIERVARTDFAVLILGETGTGKELVAQAVHQASLRQTAQFLPIDCGAIPEQLLESELFGFEKNAFTGAMTAKRGKFEAAQSGTLFLDEIANLPMAMQAKLLRVLQERVIYRIGGHAAQSVDARIVAAANEDLENKAVDGRFRSDLFFRLSEFVIHLPPLRERPEDIRHLTQRFLEQTNKELGKAVGGCADTAYDCLLNYSWPGNVRQLRNTIRQAVLLAGDEVTPAHLDIAHAEGAVSVGAEPAWGGESLKEVVRRNTEWVERRALKAALQTAHGNKALAARLLHIDYKTIHSKIKAYSLEFEGVDDE